MKRVKKTSIFCGFILQPIRMKLVAQNVYEKVRLNIIDEAKFPVEIIKELARSNAVKRWRKIKEVS